MTNRIMIDSITPGDIPHKYGGSEVDIVAGYDTGKISQWPAAAWKEFGSAELVHVDVTGTHYESDVLDVENGDATPAHAALWALEKHRQKKLNDGFPPIVYVNRGNITAVFNAMKTVGLEIGTGFKTWVATLDGTTRIEDMTGVVAIQADGADRTGGHFDVSVVWDDTWKSRSVAPVTPSGGSVERGILVFGESRIHLVESSDGNHWTSVESIR